MTNNDHHQFQLDQEMDRRVLEMQNTPVVREIPELEIGYQGIRGRPFAVEHSKNQVSRPVSSPPAPSTSIYEIREIFFTTPPRRIKAICKGAPKKPKRYNKTRFDKAYNKIMSKKDKSVAKKVRKENKVAKSLNVKIKRMTKEEYELLRLYASIDYLNAKYGVKYPRRHDIGKVLSITGPKGRLGRTGHDPYKSLEADDKEDKARENDEDEKLIVEDHVRAQKRIVEVNPLDYIYSEMDLKYLSKKLQGKVIDSNIYSKQLRELYYELVHLKGGQLRQTNEEINKKLEKLEEEERDLKAKVTKFNEDIMKDSKCDIVPCVEFLNL